MQKRILQDEAGGRDTQDHAERAPEDEGRGDDCLFGVFGDGEDGHERSGEHEALAHARGDDEEHVSPVRHPPAHDAQTCSAEQEKHDAAHERPF